jgi:ubiquinone/menaquinone biosynthesis C-methylase UbiE
VSDEQTGYIGLNRFDQVDATGEAEKYIAFLDRVDGLPEVIARRRRSFELLAVGPGMFAAEIGCGTGTAARELAALVHPGGHVYGFDISGEFITLARARAFAASAKVEFQTADALALPLANASLDIYRAERVFMHLKRPEAALAEAFRVLRPGGRILVMDQDWDTALFEGELQATRLVTRAFADSMVNGMVARRMRSLLLQSGFKEVDVQAEAVVVTDGGTYGWVADTVGKAALASPLDPAIVEAWVADQRRRIAEGRFLYASTHFITTARRP